MTNVNDISFGVEIECYVDATLFQQAGLVRHGYHSDVHQSRANGWRIESDASLSQAPTSNHIGTEWISPVLRGRAGLDAVLAQVQLIKRLGGRVNATCGLHVTVKIDNQSGNGRQLKDLVTSVAHFETALYAMTGSQRRATNGYAYSMRTSLRRVETINSLADLHYCGARIDKMQSLNVSKAANRGLVEFRVFSGTLNPSKLTGYIMVALGLVQKASATRKKAIAWDAPQATTKCLTRTGVGATAVERLFKYLGWTREASAKTTRYGMLFATKAEWMPAVNVLREMAKKYDANSPEAVRRRAAQALDRERAAARRRLAARAREAAAQAQAQTTTSWDTAVTAIFAAE